MKIDIPGVPIGEDGIVSGMGMIIVGFLLCLSVSCGFFGSARNANDVRVRQQEEQRDFLYSKTPQQLYVNLSREKTVPSEERKMYRWKPEGRALEEVDEGMEAKVLSPGEGALLSLEPGRQGPSIHFWNWLQEKTSEISLQLSALSVREVDTSSDSTPYEVVFTARERAFFPFSDNSDFELFKARVVQKDQSGRWELSDLKRLTSNDRDDLEPSFSPNGEWIVFVREANGTQGIFRMDHAGESVRPLTDSESARAYHPVILPGNQRCLYVKDMDGVSSFYTCKLDGSDHKRASNEQLSKRLFSWDDQTRYSYMVTDAFANDMSLRLLLGFPQQVGLKELLLLMEWNAPGLKSYREKIRAAREERRLHQLEDSGSISTGATHVVDVGTLFDEPEASPGDRSVEDLTRYLLSLEVPLFTSSLKQARKQRDLWQEAVYTQTYRKRYAERAHRVIQAYFKYSEQQQRVRILKRRHELNRKRLEVLNRRIEVGWAVPSRRGDARGHLEDTEAQLEEARGKARVARDELITSAGINPNTKQFIVEPATLNGDRLTGPVPDFRRFQALMQVNHPELRRLQFMELRAAAIRDLGPPESRRRPTLGLSYGVGVDQLFGEVIDDFVSTSLGYALSLTKTEQDRTYRQQWTHEMKQFRRERHQHRMDLISDLRSAREALSRLSKKFTSATTWRNQSAENVRKQKLYRDGYPIPDDGDVVSPTSLIKARLSHQKDRLTRLEVRGSYLRHAGKYYYRAGLIRRFLSFLREQKTADQTGAGHSLYLRETLNVIRNPAEREQFLSLCEKQEIRRVYVFLSKTGDKQYLKRHSSDIAYLIKQMRSKEIDAYALLGNSNWLNPSYRGKIVDLVQGIHRFNRQQGRQERFVGVQLDVEPHARSGWESKEPRQTLQDQYVQMLKHVGDQLQHGKPGALSLSVTVPHSWERYRGTEFLETLFRQVDSVSVMSYFTNGARISDRARPLVREAASRKKPVEVVIETQDGPGGSTSFASHTPDQLFKAISVVNDQFTTYPTVRRIALHDYRGMKALMETRENGH